MNILGIFSSLVLCLGHAQSVSWQNPWKNPALVGNIVFFPNNIELNTEEVGGGTVVFGEIIGIKEANDNAYEYEEIVGNFLAHTLMDSNPIGLPVDCFECNPILTDAVECSMDDFANATQFARTNANSYTKINQDSSIDERWKVWEVLQFDNLVEEATTPPQSVFYFDANEVMMACALLQPTLVVSEMAEQLIQALNVEVPEVPINTTLSASSGSGGMMSTFVVWVVSMAAVTVLLFV